MVSKRLKLEDAHEVRDRRYDADTDLVAAYMRDVEQRERLDRDEETALVRDMIERREEIADLLRAVLLKACDTLAVDACAQHRNGGLASGKKEPVAGGRPIEEYVAELSAMRAAEAKRPRSRVVCVRTAVAHLADKVRLRSLESKIQSAAAVARRAMRALQRGATSRSAAKPADALLKDIAASFGMSAQEITRVATMIAEKRRLIEQVKQRIVENNLRLVVYFARRVKWRGVDVADLIQEGNIALMNAVDSFDPDRGLAFGTFATIGVRRAIQRCGARDTQLIRLPEEVRVRRHRVRLTASYLVDKDGTPPTWDQIAEYLDVSKREVVDAFDEAGEMISLDDIPEAGPPMLETVSDPAAVDAERALADAELGRLVYATIAQLDKRKRGIIAARYSSEDTRVPSTLEEVGNSLGVTRERARQLENRALQALRKLGSAPAEQRRAARRKRPRSRRAS